MVRAHQSITCFFIEQTNVTGTHPAAAAAAAAEEEQGAWKERGRPVGGLHKLGLQLAGQQALIDIVQDLVHQLGHDEALPGQRVGDAQLWHQEHPTCRTTLNMTNGRANGAFVVPMA